MGAGPLVIQTREVSFSEYLDGLRFATAVFLLLDCRGLFTTSRLLNALELASFREVFEQFATWLDGLAISVDGAPVSS